MASAAQSPRIRGVPPFVHLHTASGHSMRYGVSHPHTLVQRAAEHGMDTLALTDRDGVYGAVAFVKACAEAGIRPVLGADLAVLPDDDASAGPRPGRRTPAHGGAFVDPRHPRVTVLARGRDGWAALCRLVSDAHRGRRDGLGTRPDPACTWRQVADRAADGDLVVLLGPDSWFGRAAVHRGNAAAEHLARAAGLVPSGSLFVEIVCHLGPAGGPRSRAHAARMLALAADAGVPAVLTNAVRYADPDGAAVADVLDAARRLVPLSHRHLDRVSAEGWLKPTLDMVRIAAEVVCQADHGTAAALLATTRALADSLVLDPTVDLGMGSVHFPEPEVIGIPGSKAAAVLRSRCEAGLGLRGMPATAAVRERLDDELALIGRLGLPSYFLTVADVVDLVREMGVRVAARGSGAGSLVNHLIGISGVDPVRHGLIMERFVSDRRAALPDIDIDVESARRTDVYRRVFERFGSQRCACVSMTETYRARHALRDVGAALGMPAGDIDTIAKSFPHVRAREVRAALRDLPELRTSPLAAQADAEHTVALLLDLAERLDGLPRHLALHPCGVLLSDTTLLDRTPVEASAQEFPMSQFGKDDVEDLGLLKLDVLGVRMQSAMAHALEEIERTGGGCVDLDAVPLDDPATFDLIRSTRTLGCFQIESPGQRELIGKFAPETFDDLVIDISLFRPGPVKSDMVTPFLRARQGWAAPAYPHPDLRPALAETEGVVVFHEQVIRIVSVMTGCDLARADAARRALGTVTGQTEVRDWFCLHADRRGYPPRTVAAVWDVLASFASFGFCKAHAAAFALPTYQSAWLKAHHTAAFVAGLLTHDPGMYPKRLILDDARQFGVPVLGVDINLSGTDFRIEPVAVEPTATAEDTGTPPEGAPPPAPHGVRIALSEIKGISGAEIDGIVQARPFTSLADFFHRTATSRPVAERLVMVGAFDGLRPPGTTRRDMLLQLTELDRYGRVAPPARTGGARPRLTQLTLSLLGDEHRGWETPAPTGLPEMSPAERVRAELEVLGLDAGRHVVDFYQPFLDALGTTRARDLRTRRNRSELLVAGVKVATQTPPVRSGRRVVFLTLDDATGPVDATFFEDAQGPYAATLFHSWLLVVRGVLRRTGPRGVSLRATGCWELPALHQAWRTGGPAAVTAMMEADAPTASEEARAGAARSRSTRPVTHRTLVHPSGFRVSPYADLRPAGTPAGSAPRRLWHSSQGSPG